MSIISYRQNVFISKGSLGIGQLSSIQYFRTIAVSKEDAQVKILPTESIVDTAIEIRQGITNNGLISFSNLVVFTTVHVLKFPVTWLDILLVAMIRYTVLQCISFGCSIVIEVFHLIQSVSHITVELSQWLIYSNLMGCPRTTITKVGQIQLYIFTCQFLNLVLVVGESNRSVPSKIFGYDVCRIDSQIHTRILSFACVDNHTSITGRVRQFGIQQQVATAIDVEFRRECDTLVQETKIYSYVECLICLPFQIGIRHLTRSIACLCTVAIGSSNRIHKSKTLITTNTIVTRKSITDAEF